MGLSVDAGKGFLVSALVLQPFALVTFNVILQPSGVALEILKASRATTACTVSGTRLGARRVNEV